MTRQALLAQADSIPGAWIGIRIAALLLWLSGWKSPAIAQLFGVSRWAVCQWIGLANAQGLAQRATPASAGAQAPAQRRRPAAVGLGLARVTEKLRFAPHALGTGFWSVEYLRRFHHVELKVRQAQRYVRRLGFTLQMPIYRYLQAKQKGVAQFQRAVKKNFARC